ncbi:uncharacterized protein [Argopecten irradians]|uniref:uncharacterized protein n=1 Tax=Argopecten irradians TaxID=31199 RepID=UPI0037167E81
MDKFKVHEAVQTLTWPLINDQYRAKYENILAVIDLLLTIPASSAECERGFSCMKEVKTAYRNRLSSTAMSDLMAVQLLSPGIEQFTPTPAIHKWNADGSRARRPDSHITHSTQTEADDTLLLELPLPQGKEEDGINASDSDFSELDSDIPAELSDLGSEMEI